VVLRLRAAGISLGSGCRFFGTPVIHRYRGSEISVGNNVEIRSSRTSNVLGLAHPTMITTLTPDARIRIANDVGLSGTIICAAIDVAIGPRSIAGADVLITDTDHHSLNPEQGRHSLLDATAAPIIIGCDVFIGARAIILKGSQIGDGAVVGAGAVVGGRVPSRAIVAGNPAITVGWVGEGMSAARAST
jgi:acetyltransferase-like isoleucine patch superfamily enzyme